MLKNISLAANVGPVTRNLWRRLCDLGISKVKPTHRGCSGGRLKKPLLYSGTTDTLQSGSSSAYESLFSGHLLSPVQPAIANSLNIQADCNVQQQRRIQFVPKIMVSNVMSLVPKVDEVQEFINYNEIDLAFITETWLKKSIPNSVINIEDFSIIRRDRFTSCHGGVCLYVKNNYSKYQVLDEVKCCDLHEVLWIHHRPRRLPRGFSCLITATVYHPPSSDDVRFRDHLFDSLKTLESKFPNCGIIIGGDFNRADVSLIKKHFHLKQIVKSPTRKDAILDLILTNLGNHFNTPSVLSPFGLSDHNTIMAYPTGRMPKSNTRKVVYKRDTRPSCKAALNRYLSELDWPSLFSSANSCEELCNIFNASLTTGLDLLMPYKKKMFHKKRRSMDVIEIKNSHKEKTECISQAWPQVANFQILQERG